MRSRRCRPRPPVLIGSDLPSHGRASCDPACSRRRPAHATWLQRSKSGLPHWVRSGRPLVGGHDATDVVWTVRMRATSPPARCIRRRRSSTPLPSASSGGSFVLSHVLSSPPTLSLRLSARACSSTSAAFSPSISSASTSRRRRPCGSASPRRVSASKAASARVTRM